MPPKPYQVILDPRDRDRLGRVVREAWVAWAMEQPDPKSSWLVPYDDLPERDKEADRRIGEAVTNWLLGFDPSSDPPRPGAGGWYNPAGRPRSAADPSSPSESVS